jgi:hypothetical protein
LEGKGFFWGSGFSGLASRGGGRQSSPNIPKKHIEHFIMAEIEQIQFVAWKEITLFHNLIKNLKGARDYYEKRKAETVEAASAPDADSETIEEVIAPTLLKVLEKPVTFKAKVKLHGSNFGVALCGDQLRAQSRSQFIDRSGMGRLVFEKNEAYWRSLVVPGGPQAFTVFGEYCGKGVQKGVALAQLNTVFMAVFGIDIGGRLVVEPAEIEAFLTLNGKVKLPNDVLVLPWYETEYELDLSQDTEAHMAEVEKVLEKIDVEVQKIDSKDPWVERMFNVAGPGEGLVLYPVSLLESVPALPNFRTISRDAFGAIAFKAKGEKHRVVTAAKSVAIVPEKAAGAEAFAKLMCPEPRLEQGASTVGGFDPKLVRDFIAWVAKDVQKEGQHELEASKLTWKDVTGPINKLASAWYLAKIKAIQAGKDQASTSANSATNSAE